MSWIYLLSELFCEKSNSREKSKHRENVIKVEKSKSREKSKSARKGNDDKKSHPPKGPGACQVLLAGVSFLKVIGAACFDLPILSLSVGAKATFGSILLDCC